MKLLESEGAKSAFGAKLAGFSLLAIAVTFLICFALNIQISAFAIESQNVNAQIMQTKQDIQSIKFQMDQKGSTIADRAKALGMVQRDKTISLRLDLQRVAVQDNSKVDLPAGNQ